jgi:hypothetical protein
MFAQAIALPSPPEKGIYCSVDVVHQWPSKMADAFTVTSMVFLTVLPTYSDTSQDIIQFDLYIDKKLKKVYQYHVTRVRGMWIAFLPFAWINLLTPSRRRQGWLFLEALSATIGLLQLQRCIGFTSELNRTLLSLDKSFLRST